jgi:solute:Na+ symporter, SSS family
VTLVTTALPIQVMTGWDMTWVIVGVGAFTIAYTMIGGIEAVVWTNAVQGILIVVGLLLIIGVLLFSPETGAPGAVVAEAWRGGRFALGSFEFSWRSLFDTTQATQWMFILAAIMTWGRRYVTDQHMVQRYLIAKSDHDARVGAFWGAFLCVPIWLTFMCIGACLYGYYQITGYTPPKLADEIVPHFLVNTLPAGLVGLILATILAASMSTVSADLNRVATVLTTDFFIPLSARSSDGTRLVFGRIMVLVAGILATVSAWLLLPGEGLKPLMERGATIGAIISGGSVGLFFLGYVTRRGNRAGCYVGIAACLLFTTWGILTQGGEERWVDLGFNFPMHPILIGVFGHVVLFGVGLLASLLIGGKPPENVEQLTIWRKSLPSAVKMV